MFGYHDSPSCSFDIWAPNPTAWGDNAIENRAFSPYAKHTQEVEDVISMIGNGAMAIECDDDMSADDMCYIESEVRKRYGMDISLS
jgi:hypothetical protein